MTETIKERQKTIYASFTLSRDDSNTLSLLYYPLIGESAYGLYMVLTSLLERNNLKSEDFSAQDFLAITGLSAAKLTKALKILQGIGLMEHYQNDGKELFVLKAPLSPKAFLLDGTYGLFLKHKIGEDLTNYLIKHFQIAQIDKSEYENVTASFDEVFKSDFIEYHTMGDCGFLINKKNENSFVIKEHNFNYESFFAKINPDWIEKPYIEKFKKCIISTSYVYGFDEDQLVRLATESLNRNSLFDFKLFRAKANNSYTFAHKSDSPSLKVKGEENIDGAVLALEHGTAVQIIQSVETDVTPDFYKTINDVYTQIELPRGVLNCMILYALQNYSSQSQPTLAFFKKMSDTWIQKGLVTTEKAYLFTIGKDISSNHGSKESNYNKGNYQKKAPAQPEWIDEVEQQIKKGIRTL